MQELVADNGSLKKQCEGYLKALEAFKLRAEEGLTLHPLSNPAADRACSPATSPAKPDYQVLHQQTTSPVIICCRSKEQLRLSLTGFLLEMTIC